MFSAVIGSESIIEPTIFSVYDLLSASDDASVKLWNLESKSCIRIFMAHTDGINCLAVTRNCR